MSAKIPSTETIIICEIKDKGQIDEAEVVKDMCRYRLTCHHLVHCGICFLKMQTIFALQINENVQRDDAEVGEYMYRYSAG